MNGYQLGHLLLACSIMMGAAGHTLLKHLVGLVPSMVALLRADVVLTVPFLGKAALALALLLSAFAAWLGAIRYLDLGYAYALASGAVLVVALLAATFLGENLRAQNWLGLVLVVVGCILMAPDTARAAS